MAKKKKIKLTTFGLVIMVLSMLGFIASVVGLFVPWFASSGAILGVSATDYFGLFNEVLLKTETTFPFALVTVFGVASAVVALFGAALTVAKGLNFVKIGFIAKILAVAIIVVVGALTLVFAFSYAGNVATIGLGDLGGTSFIAAVGAYLSGVGAIVSGGALFFK